MLGILVWLKFALVKKIFFLNGAWTEEMEKARSSIARHKMFDKLRTRHFLIDQFIYNQLNRSAFIDIKLPLES